MDAPAPAPLPGRRLPLPTSTRAGLIVLFLFWGLLIAASWNESLTGDESIPPLAGYSYWKYGDFRLDPENGNLPQRLAALPLLGYPFPAKTSPNWLTPSQWNLGEEWFHGTLRPEDVPTVLRLGRGSNALLAVALAALVWFCSRRMFGPVGGMVSLLLCVLNPTILANGSLMTSEIACAFFFLAASWTWWELMQKLTPGRLALSALAVSGLVVSKMSAGLIIPIALVLAMIRLVKRQPLPVDLGQWRPTLSTRRQQAAGIAVAGIAQALIAYVVLWGFYDFRYSAFAPGEASVAGSQALWNGMLGETSLPEQVERLGLPGPVLERARQVISERSAPHYGWSPGSDKVLAELKQSVLTPEQATLLDARIAKPENPGVAKFILFLAAHHVFPEAYLVGTLDVWRFAQMRPAFLDGEHYLIGKTRFFPYTFAVKTPLPLLGLIALAAFGAWKVRRKTEELGWTRALLWYSLPFWALFGAYWLVLLNLKLNIGHRHLIPVYPPLFVLCGAAGLWLQGWQLQPRQGPVAAVPWNRLLGWVTGALLVAHAGETAWRFPHYLAYFNGILSPATAYRHFIDSTIDWGQDLPGVKAYIDRHPDGKPFYLSFFGNGDPRTYGIAASFLPSSPGRFRMNSAPIVITPVSTDSPPASELEALKKNYPAHNYLGITNLTGRSSAVFNRAPETWELRAGTYLISATSIQNRYGEYEERAYQNLRETSRGFLAPATQQEAAESLRKFSLLQWREILDAWEHIRENRLQAFLRQYDPDDSIGYSILVFHVTDADLTRALEGPAPFGHHYLERTLSGK